MGCHVEEGLTLFRMDCNIEGPGWQFWVQHKDNIFQESEKEKQYFKGCWICPRLKDKRRLNDCDRNALETVGRPARTKGIITDS